MTPCSMHPTRPAHWHCPKCKQSFCPDCVIKQDAGPMAGGRLLRSCPKCLNESQWIGSSDLIKPFWERLPKFFTYPLKPGTLIYMAILALLGAVFFWSWVVQFICWVLLLNYAYVSLKKTAAGNLSAPGVDEMIAGNFVDVLIPVVKQAVLYLILIVLGFFIAGKLGALAALLYLLLAIFLLPSMIIVLVNTESLTSALNPQAFLFLPVKIGKGYFIMFFFLAILFMAPGALLQWFLPYLPAYAGAFLKAFAENFYTVISYHMMGYVLLQYHETIGFEIGADDVKTDARSQKEVPDPPAEREKKIVAVLCREGRFDQAIEHIGRWHEKGAKFDAELSEQYFQLLKNRGDSSGMLSHAPVYLEFAVSEGKKKDAIETFDACRKLDPEFSLNAPLMLKLGEWLAETGRFKDALRLFSRLSKRHPDADEVPLSYFRAAQIYHDRMMDSERAKKIMKTLLKKFPDHAMQAKFQNYLQYIGG